MQRRDFLKTAGIGTLAFTTVGFETACNVPSWVVTAEGIAGDIVPIAGTILSIIDPPLAPLVNLVVVGFNAVKKALMDYQNAINSHSATPSLLQPIQDAFGVLQNDAASLLNAFGSSSSHLDSVIVGIINLIAQAVSDIASHLPSAMTKKFGAVKSHFPQANNWKGSDFTKNYNAQISGDSRFKKL